ncbi:MAG: hypothetical protein KatS3mg108_1737 [Isosphaeraceae bacterium]|jgi:hypothetical protein|nr:MAG: hypothetical protein KatS3mg108_1737 [Isosphaeraceae bacterium]
MAHDKLPLGPSQALPEAHGEPCSSGISQPAPPIVDDSSRSSIDEGTADRQPDGSFLLDLPLGSPPASGTPMQVILYGPRKPADQEGTSRLNKPNGSITLDLSG